MRVYPRRAVYAGSFDPLTNGHLWVIQTACDLVDELIVAIGENPDKKYTFSLNDRLDMLRESVNFSSRIKIDSFQNQFLIDYASSQNVDYIIRGVRNAQDFEFERTLQNINSEISSSTIKTILLSPPKQLSDVSSSIVKSLCGPHNWESIVSKMVPLSVFSKLKEWKKNV